MLTVTWFSHYNDENILLEMDGVTVGNLCEFFLIHSAFHDHNVCFQVCNNQDWSWKDWCFGEEFSFKGSRGREGNRGKPGKRGRRGIGRRNKCKN